MHYTHSHTHIYTHTRFASSLLSTFNKPIVFRGKDRVEVVAIFYLFSDPHTGTSSWCTVGTSRLEAPVAPWPRPASELPPMQTPASLEKKSTRKKKKKKKKKGAVKEDL